MFEEIIKEIDSIKIIADFEAFRKAENREDKGIRKIFSIYLDLFFKASKLDKIDIWSFVSKDLAAIHYKKVPVIFFGANNWAEKYILEKIKLDELLEKWENKLDKLLFNIKKKVCFTVIPEKDFLIKYFLGANECGYISDSINRIFEKHVSENVGFVYINHYNKVKDKRIENYLYYDSHLLSRDYLFTFFEIMHTFNLMSSIDIENFRLVNDNSNSHFESKFS